MCQRPDYELEEMELDEALLKAYRRWKTLLSHFLEDEEIQAVDWVDHFACGARKRLRELQGEPSFSDTELEELFDECRPTNSEETRTDVRNDAAG